MKFSRLALFAFLNILVATTGSAQRSEQSDDRNRIVAIPRLVRFTDVLKAESGAALPSTVGVTFAVYAEREGGVALWQETQNVSLNEQGRYNVLLGSASREGLPVDLFSSGEPRWLGLRVELPGEAEQPRLLLVSVPYAMKAADAHTLGGRPATDYVLRDHLRGISGVPTSSLINGDQEIRSTSGTSQALVSGVVNFIGKFTPTGADIGSSQLFDNGTGVGIGTTSPAGLFDVRLSTNTNRNALNTVVVLQNSSPISSAVVTALNMELNDSSAASNLSKQAARMVYIRDSVATGAVSGFDSVFTTTAIINANAPYQLRGANFEFPRVSSGKSLTTYFGLYLEGPPAGNGAVLNKLALVTEPGAGNVGFGTTNPLDPLHVVGTVRATGGIRFGDGSLQTTATAGGGAGTVTSIVGGAGLTGGMITTSGTLAANFTPAGGSNGTATTVARGDHLHDTRYLQISPQAFTYSNASLSGRYAFSYFGTVTVGASLYVASAIGTLQADGNGQIVSGSISQFSSLGINCTGTITGTYSVSSSGQGTVAVTITTFSPGCATDTAQLAIQVTQSGASLVFAQNGASEWLAGTGIRQ